MTAPSELAAQTAMDPHAAHVQSGYSWWQGAVIYQVYPRSFRDSTGDGIGDLRGCLDGLEHIASLGCDAVWLSPFFASPMDDFGYDISDYYAVDPIFGSLDDYDALVEKAHKLGLKVIIDQVYSHTSDHHAWFQESRQNRTNPKADWYVWADPKPDGSPPSNWQSVFGGAAWEWDNNRRQYYLHNFLTSQPDLNLHNNDVQEALLDVARFWLDRGTDGFRLDALNFAMHDRHLRDNPAARTFTRPPTRPFDFQEHRYNKSHPDIPLFLERLRGVIDQYEDRFTVAEIGGDNPLAEMRQFTEGDKRLNTAYDFQYLYADQLTKDLVVQSQRDWPETDRWPSWAFSNHDAPRAVSRWKGGCQASDYAKFMLLLLMSLRGNIFIYQGEELGLEQADIPFELLKDPEAIANWPETLGRDGARTPIPWQRNEPSAGFSQGQPWLPVDPRHAECSIDAQNADPASVLHFLRELSTLRAHSPALKYGDIEFLDSPEAILAFTRTGEGQRVLCVFNMSEDNATWTPGTGAQWRMIKSVNLQTDGGESAKIPDTLTGAGAYIAMAE